MDYKLYSGEANTATLFRFADLLKEAISNRLILRKRASRSEFISFPLPTLEKELDDGNKIPSSCYFKIAFFLSFRDLRTDVDISSHFH